MNIWHRTANCVWLGGERTCSSVKVQLLLQFSFSLGDVPIHLLPWFPKFLFSPCAFWGICAFYFLTTLLIYKKKFLCFPTQCLFSSNHKVRYIPQKPDRVLVAKRGWYVVVACGYSYTCLHPQRRPCNLSFMLENSGVLNHRAADTKLWLGPGWKSSACPGECHFVYDWPCFQWCGRKKW